MELSELTELAGVSGDEQCVRDALAGAAQTHGDSMLTDSMGNLIVCRGETKTGPRVMCTAHMDEPGFIITGIHDSGLLHCLKVGDLNERAVLGTHVMVGRHRIPGVIGGKPIHLLQGEERSKVPKVSDILIDIGATDKKSAEALVNIGDYATYATSYAEIGAEYAKGKALAGRVGCYALLQLLQLDLPFPFYAVFTVQKEIGLRGARIAAYRVEPQIAFVLDGTPANDVSDEPNRTTGVHLGGGPTISVADRSAIAHRPLSQWLVDTATQAAIPYQWQQSTSGRSDAGAIQLAREGVRVATISTPCRYIGNPVSMVSLNDVSHTIRLVEAALLRLAREGYRP